MPRLLYVDAKWARPSVDAGSQRAIQLVGELVRIGYDVDFGALFPSEAGGLESAAIDLAGSNRVYAANEDALLGHIARHGRDYEVAVVAWTRVATRLIEPLRGANPDLVIVFDTVDVNHVREYRHARVSGNANILRRALAMKQAELGAVRAADLTIAISEADARVLRDGVPSARVEVVTMAVDGRAGPAPGPQERKGALYLGNYMAWHNVDAVTHLAQDIVPYLDAAGSSLPITLAGAGSHDLIRVLESDRLRVVGFVPEIEPVMDGQRMFVAPLRVGSGIKGKLLTALAAGLPIVASPVAVEGIPVVDGESALLAQTPAEFADACLRLESDDALWRQLSAGSISVVAEHFSRELVSRQAEQAFAGLLAVGPAKQSRSASR